MKIKNWKKFQHFKDRRPPWIKLHREILEQRDINTISDRAFRLLVNLWVLASDDKEMLGNLPEVCDIAWKLRKSEKEISELLQELEPWIDYSDIDLISPCLQLVPPETETEAYKEETEEEKEKTSVGKPTIAYEDILDTMNGILGTKYQNTDGFKKLVKARVKDGFTVEDFETVVHKQKKLWGNDRDMKQFLRPVTIFGVKMNEYFGAGDNEVEKVSMRLEDF